VPQDDGRAGPAFAGGAEGGECNLIVLDAGDVLDTIKGTIPPGSNSPPAEVFGVIETRAARAFRERDFGLTKGPPMWRAERSLGDLLLVIGSMAVAQAPSERLIVASLASRESLAAAVKLKRPWSC
jgi:hypothetical protein